MFRRILPPIEDVRAAGVGVIWRRPSFNDTKTKFVKYVILMDQVCSNVLVVIVPITALENVKKEPGNITNPHVKIWQIAAGSIVIFITISNVVLI